ncbi:MAG: hypothetical protein U5K27_09765 [Desulfotignum sp.]|nr:hypothetical protein [Desulfotignum sp.]
MRPLVQEPIYTWSTRVAGHVGHGFDIVGFVSEGDQGRQIFDINDLVIRIHGIRIRQEPGKLFQGCLAVRYSSLINGHR